MHESGPAAMSRRPEMARWAVGALSRGPGEARRILGVEQAARRLLLGGVMPLWLGAGLADWYLHRRTHIGRTAGRTAPRSAVKCVSPLPS